MMSDGRPVLWVGAVYQVCSVAKAGVPLIAALATHRAASFPLGATLVLLRTVAHKVLPLVV